MAITNPQAVAFSNVKIRPTADTFTELYNTCKVIVSQWNALGMGTLITNTTDNIVDGSATDGRNPIDGIQATAIITQAMAYISLCEANSNAVLNDFIQVAVNGRSAF